MHGALIAPVRAGDTGAALHISLVLKIAVFDTCELLYTERRCESSRGTCRSLALGLGMHVPRAYKPLTGGYVNILLTTLVTIRVNALPPCWRRTRTRLRVRVRRTR